MENQVGIAVVWTEVNKELDFINGIFIADSLSDRGSM